MKKLLEDDLLNYNCQRHWRALKKNDTQKFFNSLRNTRPADALLEVVTLRFLLWNLTLLGVGGREQNWGNTVDKGL